MDPLVESLARVVSTERVTALHDSQWLAKALRSRHPADSRIFVLCAAVVEDLPQQLLAGGSQEVFAHRLQSARSIEAPMAHWAASAWRQALRLSSG